MNYDKTKHLEFVQGIIQRMNSNSFQIKGLAITILAAILTLFATNNEIDNYLLVPILPTVIFWFLDSFYLSKERKFIELYNRIIGTSNSEVAITNYDLSIKGIKTTESSFWRCLFSFSTLIIYIPIIASLIIAFKNI